MGLTLDAAGRLIDTDPAAARALLYEARDASAKALAELRDLVRGIHPPVLADRGLADAVRALALDSPLRVRVTGTLPGRPPAPVESAAYFAVSELLANVAKHAGALAGRGGPAPRGRRAADQRQGRRAAAARTRRGAPACAASSAGSPRSTACSPCQQPGRRPDRRHPGSAVRVVIAEDLFLLREGLIRLLEAYGFEVAAATDNGEDFLAAIRRGGCDVAVVDVRLPPTFTDEGLQGGAHGPRRDPRPAGPCRLPVRRAALRPRAARRRRGRGRLPAQGPGTRRRPVHRRGDAGRARRHRDGPRGHRPAAGPQQRGGRPDRQAQPPRARGTRADGGGPFQRGDRGPAVRHRARGRQAHRVHLRQARTCSRPTTTTAASWPSSPTWAADPAGTSSVHRGFADAVAWPRAANGTIGT